MGIDKLNKFLQKKTPNAYIKKSVYDFENQKVAFDVSLFMYKYMSYALKIVVNKTNLLEHDIDRKELLRIWINAMIKSLCIWLTYKITPVMVFDGVAGSIKNDTLQTRWESKKLKKEKIATLTEQIRTDPLTYCHLIKDLKHQLINYIELLPEDKLLFKNVLESIGLPCLTATSEAEQLCAMLCKEKYCVACYSLDTDLLCYGCPIMITSFSDEYGIDENGYQEIQLNCIFIHKVLEQLNMTEAMFVDFCILLGCDYNTSIKQIGPEKAYKLILKHLTIENIPKDTSCLNHLVCREAFKNVEAKKLVSLGNINDLNMKPYNPIYFEYTKNHAYNIKLCYNNLKMN